MAKRVNNRVSTKDVIRLHTWMQRNLADIEKKRLTSEEVARWAGKELGIHLTDNNVRAVAGNSERSLIRFEWPRGGNGQRSKVTDARYKLLFMMVEELRESLGYDPQGELGTLWFKLREELGIALEPVLR